MSQIIHREIFQARKAETGEINKSAAIIKDGASDERGQSDSNRQSDCEDSSESTLTREDCVCLEGNTFFCDV